MNKGYFKVFAILVSLSPNLYASTKDIGESSMDLAPLPIERIKKISNNNLDFIGT